MTRILGISGSLRRGSLNTAVLRAAQSLVDTGVELEIATLHGIPLYDGDVEQSDGLPRAVVELKEQIVASDGVILATPEYNTSLPGVFKNAIDWLSGSHAMAGALPSEPLDSCRSLSKPSNTSFSIPDSRSLTMICVTRPRRRFR